MAIVYGLKVNLSVAMVAMLNHTAIKLSAGGEHTLPNVTSNAHAGSEECAFNETAAAKVEVNP